MADAIQLDYDPAEDRLVLTFRRDQGEPASATEIAETTPSLLLTRRVVAAWRPNLRAAAERSVGISPQLHPAARKVIATAHHEVMASQARKSSLPPLRVESIRQTMLVRRVLTGLHRDGHWVLRFEMYKDGAFALKLTTAMLHAFIAMLDRRIAKAGWDISILAHNLHLSAPASNTKH